MAQISKYTDKAAYNSDSTRSKTKSAVSFIENNNEQVFDGVNIVVEKNAADIGDLVVFDKVLLRNRFIKAKTLVKAQIPANLYPHSVVLGWRGDRLMITPLANAGSARWAHPFEVRISGINPSVAGSLAIIVHNNGSLSEEVDVSWSAGETLSAIAGFISTQFTTLTDADDKAWTAAVDGSDIILSHNYHLADTVTSISGTGGAAGVSYVEDDRNYQATYAYLTATEYVQRKNGVRSYFGGCNKSKFLQYYSANGSSLTSAVGLGSSTIVNQNSFENSEYCSALRDAYASYEEYLFSEHLLQYPAASGAHRRDGRELTALLATQKGTLVRGENEPRYPAAAMAFAFGVSLSGYTTGLEAGAWWLPDVEEMQMMMRDRRYNSSDTNADPVNDTIVKMGGSTVYGNGYYPWTSCEYNSNIAFFYYGRYGSVYFNNKYSSSAVRPVSAL